MQLEELGKLKNSIISLGMELVTSRCSTVPQPTVLQRESLSFRTCKAFLFAKQSKEIATAHAANEYIGLTDGECEATGHEDGHSPPSTVRIKESVDAFISPSIHLQDVVHNCLGAATPALYC
jgi:hypothetical protein